MADSDQRVTTGNQSQTQEQSTMDWLYNTAVSFLPSWSSSASSEQPAVQQQQTPEGSCPKTAAPVCQCSKNKPK